MNRRQFLSASCGAGAGLCTSQAAAIVGHSLATSPDTFAALSVKSCGAAGDGRTDDTEAIQRALDQGPGAILLPPGSYRLSRTVTVDLYRGYRAVRGEAGTARVIMTGPGPAFRIIGNHQGTANPSTVKPHVWDAERMPVLTGFEILGAHEQADGIELVQTMQTVLHDLLIRRCRFGLHLVVRNRNVVISGCHVYQCADTGIFLDQVDLHQANIFGNHVSYNRRAGIRQLNGDVHNVQIVGNDIEYNSGSDESSGEILLEVPDGTASEFTIAANTIQATLPAPGANLRIAGKPADGPLGVRLIAVTGNVLGSRCLNIDLACGERITLSGNTVYGASALGVRLTRCRSVAIGSNTFVSSTLDGKTARDGLLLEHCLGCSIVGNVIGGGGAAGDESAASLRLHRCRDINVSSCQFLDPIYCGIALEDSIRCMLSDNTIVDRRPVKTMQTAVRVTGQSRDNLILNNALYRGTRAAIDCPKEMATLSNNTIWD